MLLGGALPAGPWLRPGSSPQAPAGLVVLGGALAVEPWLRLDLRLKRRRG